MAITKKKIMAMSDMCLDAPLDRAFRHVPRHAKAPAKAEAIVMARRLYLGVADGMCMCIARVWACWYSK